MSDEEQEEEHVHTIDKMLDAALEAGLSNTVDARAFARIVLGDEPRPVEVRDACRCSDATMANVLARLEKLGLVEVVGPRGKGRSVRLTRAGLELEAKMMYGTEYQPEEGE